MYTNILWKNKKEENEIFTPLSDIVASIFCHVFQYFIEKQKTEVNDISASLLWKYKKMCIKSLIIW
jgi:hypothetical protein